MDDRPFYVMPKIAASQRAAECLKRLRFCASPLVAEIGVFRGHMSMILLASRPDLRLVMVDPYETLEAPDSYKETDDFHTRMSADSHRIARSEAKLRTEFAQHRSEMMLMTSEKAAEQVRAQFDLVFIDGDHSYEGCKTDIDAWFPLVKSQGWLGGHDYRRDMGFGVIQAVEEFVAREGLPLELGENYTWFVRKP